MCRDAAEHAVDIVKMMSEHQLLSSLLPFDINCVLELMQVFLLIKYKGDPGACSEQMRLCMQACHSMPRVGWAKRTLPEITALMNEAQTVSNAPNSSGVQDTETRRRYHSSLQNTASDDARLVAQPELSTGRDIISDIELYVVKPIFSSSKLT